MDEEALAAEADVDSVEPAALKARIDAGEQVTILDVRAESEYEEWHIDGGAQRAPDESSGGEPRDGDNVEVTNVPYFDFIEGVDDELLAQVPEGDPLVVVCAKGGASAYVADILEDEGWDAVNLAEGMNGWASIYDAVEVARHGGPATVVQYQRPSSGCLGYLIVSDGEAAIVDPLRAFTDRYVADAEERGVEIAYAIDTHVHADHVSGVRSLSAASGATAVVPEPAVARGVEYDVDYETVADGDVLDVGGATVEAMHTPGHTSGMTSYLVDGSTLLTGDGLFVESVARPDLEDGDAGAPDAAGRLYDTLQERVLPLPDDTVIAPAHYSDAADPAADGTYTALLGDLKSRMEALALDREAFVEFVLADMPPRPSNFEEIIATNLGQRETDDEEAFTLELGPNNCAATREAMTGD